MMQSRKFATMSAVAAALLLSVALAGTVSAKVEPGSLHALFGIATGKKAGFRWLGFERWVHLTRRASRPAGIGGRQPGSEVS